jgi:hypothetical protein
MEALETTHSLGFPFAVQYTINGYPRELEARVTPAERSAALVRQVASRYGRRVPIWRYDPIVLTELTDWDFHRRNFTSIARAVSGYTDEVVVSFAHLYEKSARHLNEAARKDGFWWRDPSSDEKRSLASELASIAADFGLTFSICAQPDLMVAGASPARCVDASRLSDIANIPIASPTKGNRAGCECAESRDIGDYDTCPHGCVYCYAVSDPQRALTRFHRHDPDADTLFVEPSDIRNESGGRQLPLLPSS